MKTRYEVSGYVTHSPTVVEACGPLRRAIRTTAVDWSAFDRDEPAPASAPAPAVDWSALD